MPKNKGFIEVDGIKFSKDIDVEAIKALGNKRSPEFDAAMKMPAKIRITTMIDEDIYNELKRLADEAGHGKYQTILNAILKDAVAKAPAFNIVELVEAANMMRNEIMDLKKRVNRIEVVAYQNKPTKKKASGN